MKHKTLAACIKEAIELVDNCDEYREGITTSTGEADSSKGTPSNIIVRATRPPVVATTPRVPTVQEIANEIIRQMSLAPRPPVRTEPLRPQIPNANPQTFPFQQNQQQMPRQLKWCNIEKKYTNRKTHECYFRPRYEQQQAEGHQQQPPPAFRQPGYGRGQMDKPPPVLGQQPPLPGPNQVAVHFAQPEENVWEQLQALVPVVPYNEETSVTPTREYSERYETQSSHPPDLDVETLLYIARNNIRP